MRDLPATLPATFENSDPEWVDDDGIIATPRGLDFLRLNMSNTYHVRKDGYGGDTIALCGTGGTGASLDMVEFVGRPPEFEKTVTICAKCRKRWAEGKR